MACFSAITTGTTWGFTDCCGDFQSGFNSGLEICVDSSYPYSGINVSLSTCIPDCIPLTATFSVIGVCGNPSGGTVTIFPTGGVKPYTLDNTTPNVDSLSGATSNGPFTFTGLTGGTYVWRINDSTSPQNQDYFVNIIVGDCFCANVYDVSGTTCGSNNGTLQLSGESTTAPFSVEIYTGSTLLRTETAIAFPYLVSDLSSGLYTIKVYDSGGATAQTENFVVSSSLPLDYGFWQVNDSNCQVGNGKLTVTGQTGQGPYSYLWNTGSVLSYIENLTPGSYTVTVIDSLGCTLTKTATITTTPDLGIGSLSATTPTCFQSDGELRFEITGGTLPFLYSADTGTILFSSSRVFTLTGLTSGVYLLRVTDSDLCKFNTSGSLTTPNGFDVVSLNVTNSNCSSSNGSIEIILNGTVSNNYIYSITGQTNGVIKTHTTTQQNHTFNNLSNDTYSISVSGSGSNCVFTTTETITSQNKFNLTTSVTGSTCGGNNGIIEIQVSTGYTSPLDFTLSNGEQIIDTVLSAVTFESLLPGTYVVEVTDGDNCTVSTTLTVTTTGELSFGVFGTNCTNGSDGSATIKIYEGEPPFIYSWNNGDTGSTISDLSGDTYSVIVTDSNGCSLKKFVTIECKVNIVTGYTIVGICNQIFNTTSNTKRTIKKMLNEGFLDVSSGNTNCVLSAATFSTFVSITGSTGWISGDTVPFYTGYTLNDYPQDSQWKQSIENILNTISEVGSYSIDLFNNTITINSDCDGDTDPLKEAKFKLQLKIDYDLNCVS